LLCAKNIYNFFSKRHLNNKNKLVLLVPPKFIETGPIFPFLRAELTPIARIRADFGFQDQRPISEYASAFYKK